MECCVNCRICFGMVQWQNHHTKSPWTWTLPSIFGVLCFSRLELTSAMLRSQRASSKPGCSARLWACHSYSKSAFFKRLKLKVSTDDAKSLCAASSPCSIATHLADEGAVATPIQTWSNPLHQLLSTMGWCRLFVVSQLPGLVHRNRQGQHAKPQFFIKEWRSDKEWDRSQLLRPKHRGGQLPTVHLWSCCLANAPTYLTDSLRMNCLWLAGSNFRSCLRQTSRYTITCLSIWNFWRGGRYIFTAFNVFTTLPASPPLKNHTNFQIYNYLTLGLEFSKRGQVHVHISCYLQHFKPPPTKKSH